MKRLDFLSIGLLGATFLALAVAYGVVVPPLEGLDEVEHFGVVRYVADTGRLPVQGEAALAAYHVRQEASQPPLYYLLAGPLVRLSHIPTGDTAAYLTPNPYVTCGAETIRADKATLRHDPFAEAFPWRGSLLALHLLRAFSSVLQAFTVAGVYAIARRVFPHRRGVPILAAALTAFNPQFLIVASGVNNDNVATPVITWALYVTVLVAQMGLSLRRAVILGTLIGLAALSKLTGLLLLPLAALAWVINLKYPVSNFKSPDQFSKPQAEIRNPKHLHHTQVQVSEIRNLVTLGCVTLAVASWWYVRNWQLYGDPTGLGPMLDIVGRRAAVRPELFLSELGLVFRSYWGQFPCAFFDSAPYYSAWILITALGAVGVMGGLRREDRPTRVRTICLALWLGLVMVGWLRWDLSTPAPGGRLLFTAVGATSTLLAYGLVCLASLFSPRSVLYADGGAVAMAVVGLLALPVWVRPLFAPPPMVEAAFIIPQHPLKAQFGESIGLLGYDLSASGLGPGRFVDATLYWRALQPIQTDYTLALQLAALAPGDTRTLLNFNTWPGGGNLPTAAWSVGPVVADHYHVPLPQDTQVTQAWSLQVILYDARSGTRLPLTLDGQPGGSALTLNVVRVAGTASAALPDSERLTTPIMFNQAIALSHAQVDGTAGNLRVQLLWQSVKSLPRDVTVFVHAYDVTGKLVATGDGPPMKGNFPTSLWQIGDRVLDEHTLILPAGRALNDIQIKVGLYRPEDTSRLETRQGVTRLPEDAVTVWPR